ncbi:hypothetical protein SBV1_2330043 [Verrucomicrobia bacterium]|nr:hypothetical protein SBV1_2330043 [Verrucomicrobiota bacterium]
MDNLENTPQTHPETDLAELRDRYDALHHLLVSILILLILVSGTLWVYLQRQVKYTTMELENVRPGVENMVAQYQRTAGPAQDEFVRKLTEYGKTHADFAPIVKKYGLRPSGTNQSGSAPAGQKQ